ncbi:MAG TPA: cytochrome c-type biogenesis protein [Aestuariivirgaceae bacterium]|jgi:cytochrome c-type biogenesis protein CcmH
MHRLCAISLLLLWLTPALAVEPDEILSDPGLESRARSLSAGLRCLVCQNQSIDESDAPLARDLRLLIRERLKAGDSDEKVKSYLVSRYGDFVLLKPPLNLKTLLLWVSPFLLLLAGTVFIIWRRPSKPPPLRALTKEEEQRLRDLTRQ